jgi:hypothetical protein
VRRWRNVHTTHSSLPRHRLVTHLPVRVQLPPQRPTASVSGVREREWRRLV